jgi:hypothetical protein
MVAGMKTFCIEVVFAVLALVLTALTSVEAEVGWANSSRTKMWAEIEPDFSGYE